MQPVPEKARRCPHCGSPQVRSHSKAILATAATVMVLVVLTAVFLLVRHNASEGDGGQNTVTAPDKPAPLDR